LKWLTKKLLVITHASIVTRRAIGQRIAKNLQKILDPPEEGTVEDLLAIIPIKEAEVEKEAEIEKTEEEEEEETTIEGMIEEKEAEKTELETIEVETTEEKEAGIERKREDPEKDLQRTNPAIHLSSLLSFSSSLC